MRQMTNFCKLLTVSSFCNLTMSCGKYKLVQCQADRGICDCDNEQSDEELRAKLSILEDMFQELEDKLQHDMYKLDRQGGAPGDSDKENTDPDEAI